MMYYSIGITVFVFNNFEIDLQTQILSHLWNLWFTSSGRIYYKICLDYLFLFTQTLKESIRRNVYPWF